MTHRIVLAPAAQRALSHTLPESVAIAVWEFVNGPLAENPYRVGKPLLAPFEGLFSARRGTYRIVYEIQDASVIVRVVKIQHRGDAYRS
ncbi:type II toxin-antitoxin system RelE family toxin [Angustibacter aerolatus]|nr:type II toxin-antitoxin system RelE/ParE family toxin [Angustibacter aerolatus]